MLAGGSAAGQLFVIKLRASGSLDSAFGTRRAGRPGAARHVAGRREGIRPPGRARRRLRHARLADGSTRFVTLRLLPSGEIDPSFGAGRATCSRPDDAELGAMAMNRDGVVFLGGSSAGAPYVMRLLPDGTPDPAFANPALGVAGRVTGLLIRTDGTMTYTVPTGAASFTVVKLDAAGALDPDLGRHRHRHARPRAPARAGTRRRRRRAGPDDHDARRGHGPTAAGTPRGSVIRLNADGSLDTKLRQQGHRPRVPRRAATLRITAMVRDRSGRIVLAGTGRAPDSMLVRLRASGARDAKFGNGGLTFRVLGQPPGGDPVYTRFDAVDVARLQARRRRPAPAARPRAARPQRSSARRRGRASRSPCRDCVAVTRICAGFAVPRTSTLTRSCSQGTCGSCSGFISTERRTRAPSASISTSGCAAANAVARRSAASTGTPGRRSLIPRVEHALRGGVDLGRASGRVGK